MSLQKDREEFFVKLAAEGVPLDVLRLVCRQAAMVQRLAVDECNGVRDPVHWLEYSTEDGRKSCAQVRKARPPYDDTPVFACDEDMEFEGKPLPFSKSRRHRVTCPSCRSKWSERRITELLEPYNVTPIFQGDPRGACTKLKVPSGKTDDFSREGIVVPTPRY